jgi:hypothetical protein
MVAPEQRSVRRQLGTDSAVAVDHGEELCAQGIVHGHGVGTHILGQYVNLCDRTRFDLAIDPASEVIPTPEHANTLTNPALEAARRGFPGPLVTGLCLAIAPLLALAGTIAGASSYHARGSDFVAGMVAHPAGFGIGVQLSLAAMMLLMLAVVGLATMIAATRPGWARASGVTTVIGLCGPVAFESLYWGASHLTDTGAHRAAAALMLDQSQIIPRTIVNISGPCLIVGFILLGIAAAKSGVLDRPRAILLGLTSVIPVGFIAGILAISAVAFAGTAVALVPLGVTLLRWRGTARP